MPKRLTAPNPLIRLEERKAACTHDTSIASVPLVTVKDTLPASPIKRFSDSLTNCITLAITSD